MNKRKLMSSLFAGAMTLGMTLSVNPVFADEVQNGTEAHPAELWLAKELNIADGVTYNTDNSKVFKFDFTLTEFSGGTPTQSGLNDLLDTTLTVSSSDPVDSKNVLAGKKFNAAGVYTFTVTETGDDEMVDGYGLKLSEAQYEVKVYVKNGNSGTYVHSVVVNKEKDDAGNGVTGKVDPNPGENQGDDSGFRFVNTYTKQAGTPDPDDPTGQTNLALAISKEVTGDYGDKTFGFTFNVTINLPETADTAKTYTGKVGEKDYVFKNGKETEVTLSHGQKLKFEDLPAGTTYSVTETGKAGYTPTASIIENGGQASSQNADEGENLAVSNKLVGENANSTAFTNAYNNNTITPTGIIINNLPFVLMVAIAGSGLALYVVSKRRTHQ